MGLHQDKKTFAQQRKQLTKPKDNKQNGRRFANILSDKGLVSKIYKEPIKFCTYRTNNPVKKQAEENKMTLLQRRHTNGQQTHEKMLNITWHQGNTNQNHNEIPPHTSENGEN